LIACARLTCANIQRHWNMQWWWFRFCDCCSGNSWSTENSLCLHHYDDATMMTDRSIRVIRLLSNKPLGGCCSRLWLLSVHIRIILLSYHVLRCYLYRNTLVIIICWGFQSWKCWNYFITNKEFYLISDSTFSGMNKDPQLSTEPVTTLWLWDMHGKNRPFGTSPYETFDSSN